MPPTPLPAPPEGVAETPTDDDIDVVVEVPETDESVVAVDSVVVEVDSDEHTQLGSVIALSAAVSAPMTTSSKNRDVSLVSNRRSRSVRLPGIADPERIAVIAAARSMPVPTMIGVQGTSGTASHGQAEEAAMVAAGEASGAAMALKRAPCSRKGRPAAASAPPRVHIPPYPPHRPPPRGGDAFQTVWQSQSVMLRLAVLPTSLRLRSCGQSGSHLIGQRLASRRRPGVHGVQRRRGDARGRVTGLHHQLHGG